MDAADDLELESLHLLWMAPLANAGIYLVPGATFALLARRWPRRSFRAAIGVFAFMSLVGLLSIHRKLDPYAVLVLAAGAAVQVTSSA